MRKIFNTSWLAVILATIAFFILGMIWYGVLFEDLWLSIEGISQEQSEAQFEEMGMGKWLFFALLITFAQAIGVLWVIDRMGAKGVGDCLKTSFWLSVTIMAPIIAYGCVYGDYPLKGYLMDFGHLFIAYMLMAFIYAMFRRKLDGIDG